MGPYRAGSSVKSSLICVPVPGFDHRCGKKNSIYLIGDSHDATRVHWLVSYHCASLRRVSLHLLYALLLGSWR